MKLTKTTGCLSDSLQVDGVEEIDLDDNTRRRALKEIGEYVKKQTLDEEGLELLREDIEGYCSKEGGELKDKTIQELGEIIETEETSSLNYILQFIVEFFGELTYHSKEPCECCGDYVYEYTLDLGD
jgi:hypothetical protein